MRGNTDPRAVDTLKLFTQWLGAYAGDLALILGAGGGVYIGGGIATYLVPKLEVWGLRDAFDDKGRLSRMVEPIPLYVIDHPYPGLLGAAMALENTTRPAP